MTRRNSIAAMKDELAAYRRSMHENPQTSFEEEFVSNLVCEKLTEWGIPFERGIAVTGVVATIEGQKNTSGRAIALRADMDALGIEEAHNKDWRSKNPGKMHGCGHDGHTAMLLGAAKYLSETRRFDGRVHLIFQPAEEGDCGAMRMIEEGLFERFPCEAVYGAHNWPYLPRGSIAMRAGPIMAAADRFDMTILGKGGHAAKPHGTIDPVVIGAQIVVALQTIISRGTDPVDPAVISITNFHAGTGAFNVIAEEAKLSGTIRSFDPEVREMLRKRVEEVASGIAQTYGAKVTCRYAEGYDPTINTPEATAFCAEVARKVVGEHNVDTDMDPSMGAEDFGAMLMQKPGCYVIIGQGEPDTPESNHNRGLHTPQYDFNDEIIPTGVEYWATLVEEALKLDSGL